MNDTPIYDEIAYEPDPPDFDRGKVPNSPLADYFFDGRTGRGLTNEEWDQQRERLRGNNADPFGGAA